MSYIKITTPDGKERGLKFNQMAMILMAQKADLSNYIATAGYAMIYAGLMANCYVKQQEPDFTFEQACDWMDELSKEVQLQIAEVFTSTQAYKDLIAKGQLPEEPITKKKSRKAALKT